MGLVSTKTPIFDDIPSIEFFNGRLLSGEDLSTEQSWNNARRNLLGQTIGSGIAQGLQVKLSVKPEFSGQPVVSVEAGLALNNEGENLHLQQRTDVSLTQVNIKTAAPVEFVDCQPTQYGVAVQTEGVYLLALCPASGTQGRAPVGGLANNEARCNRKYRRQGVQFRLHQLKLSSTELGESNKLRNRVAYKNFDPDAWKRFLTDPFAEQLNKQSLFDDQLIPKLENCEVPLATIYWTLDGGIEYVDMWSVRRDVVKKATTQDFNSIISKSESVEGQARFLQFQHQMTDLLLPTGFLGTQTAKENFNYLPPAGVIPVAEETTASDFMATQFFSGMTYHKPVFINAARIAAIIQQSINYPPVDTQSKETIWLYRVSENRISIDDSASAAKSYIVFCNGNMPYQANAQFDLSRWDYSNYA